jgi:drug/metabolite transporter (DMT)-like permease
MQYYMFGDKVSRTIQLSLCVILLGVGVATFSDVELNYTGTVFAAFAVVFTTLGQIFTHSKPKELGLDSMQLLHHASPLIAVGMFLLIPIGTLVPGFDKLTGLDVRFCLFSHEHTWRVNSHAIFSLICSRCRRTSGPLRPSAGSS